MPVETIQVKWREDGSATCLGRLTAEDGTGEWTGVNGEGNWLKVADISTITCAVFDMDSSTPTVASATPTVTVATAVQDTPVTDGKIWDVDDVGYNFKHTLAASVFPTGGHRVRCEYKVTTTGSTVGWAVFEGAVEGVFTS